MEKLLISRQSRPFVFDEVICKVLFPICTLTGRVNIHSSRQGKRLNRRSEMTDGESFIITL